jgi:hypothetical protein
MQNKIIDILKSDDGAAIGKIGFSEMKVLHSVLTQRTLNQQELHDIFVGAGVFPPTSDSINKFCEEMRSCLGDVDVLAKMRIDPSQEELVIDTFSPQSEEIELREIEPYYWDTPWSEALENKKVLIISPFVDTMQKQYKKRQHLWTDTRVLPEMTLSYMKVPLSHYIKESPYSSWAETLDELKYQMSKVSFDVCLVGAGAWSLPLAHEAKTLGKIGIHMGGPLQVLFGIKGKRWDSHEVISAFYNDFWVRPSKSETPLQAAAVEGGCYW